MELVFVYKHNKGIHNRTIIDYTLYNTSSIKVGKGMNIERITSVGHCSILIDDVDELSVTQKFPFE